MNFRFPITSLFLIMYMLSGLLALGAFGFNTPPPTNTKITSSISSMVLLDPSTLQAQAAIIYDPETDTILFSKNAEEQMPLASLTKLMTAETALPILSATSTVPITPEALAIIGNGTSGLKAGEIWNAQELIKYALLVSSNDAMAAVAQSLGGEMFIEEMNARAKSLGLVESYFLDPTGLDMTTGVSGAYSSAHDMAVLASAFYKNYPSFFESTLQSGITYRSTHASVTGKATAAPILDIPGLIGAKTGYTDLAGGNLVALFDVSFDHPLVGVVLHSTEVGRFYDIRTLITAARTSWASSTPL